MHRVVKIPMSGGSAASDLVIQVVMISESTRLQCMLANYGIQTQTPTEVEPVQVTNQRTVLFRTDQSQLKTDQSQLKIDQSQLKTDKSQLKTNQ